MLLHVQGEKGISMSHEKLREKYRITDDDLIKMDELRRKWAFDDVMNELECGAYDDLEPTDDEIEDIIVEYMDQMHFDRWESHLDIENAYMEEAIDRVISRRKEQA